MKTNNKADVAPAQIGQHTPGLWTIESGGLNRYVVEEKTGNVLASLNYPTHRSIEEERANARLIAATPDLLEALKECVAAMKEWGYGKTGVCQEARAAIAKAERGNA